MLWLVGSRTDPDQRRCHTSLRMRPEPLLVSVDTLTGIQTLKLLNVDFEAEKTALLIQVLIGMS